MSRSNARAARRLWPAICQPSRSACTTGSSCRRSSRRLSATDASRCGARPAGPGLRGPACGARVVAAMPVSAKGTPFGPRLHVVATYLKTFQALSYERLQGALADLFGLTISQGGLMNLLRRAQGRFQAPREDAVAALRRAAVVASDETGVRIEGANAYHTDSGRRTR